MGKVLGVCRFDVRIRFSVGSSYSNLGRYFKAEVTATEMFLVVFCYE